VLAVKAKPLRGRFARLDRSARLGLFATKTLSGNLARLPDKVLVDESHIGMAVSRAAPKRSGGTA
jgi:hypothetical protein